MKNMMLLLLLISTNLFATENEMTNLMDKYENLHRSFFDNNFDQVRKNARDLGASIKNLSDQQIGQSLIYAQKKLSEIGVSPSIDESKQAFNTVSLAILAVLKKKKLDEKYERYYCPMVKKYWIQNSQKNTEVMNPYASSSMPQCGLKK